MKIKLNDLGTKNPDDIWDMIQGIIPEKFLDHWLEPVEIKRLDRKLLLIRNGKPLTLREKLDLLNQNGYNIQEISRTVGENNIDSVRISE